VNVDWTRNAQGHRVDLSSIWGVLPANHYLALRIAKIASRFTERSTCTTCRPWWTVSNSIRGSFYDATWTVGGVKPDFRSIQDAINDGRVLSGDRVYVMPGTYDANTPGFLNVEFGAKDIRVIAEGGPEKTIIDCGFAARAFHFNTTSITNAAGSKGSRSGGRTPVPSSSRAARRQPSATASSATVTVRT